MLKWFSYYTFKNENWRSIKRRICEICYILSKEELHYAVNLVACYVESCQNVSFTRVLHTLDEIISLDVIFCLKARRASCSYHESAMWQTNSWTDNVFTWNFYCTRFVPLNFSVIDIIIIPIGLATGFLNINSLRFNIVGNKREN